MLHPALAGTSMAASSSKADYLKKYLSGGASDARSARVPIDASNPFDPRNKKAAIDGMERGRHHPVRS